MLHYTCFALLLVEKSLLQEIKKDGVYLSFYPGMALDAIIHPSEETSSNASERRKCAHFLYALLVFSCGDVSKERVTSVSLRLSILGGRKSKT